MAAAVLVSVMMLSCAAGADETLRTAVSIAPLASVVERIGGDRVDCLVLVPPAANLHNFEPKPRQLTDLSRCTLYFAIGVEFENIWLEKFRKLNRDMAVVPLDSGITKIPMQSHGHDHAEHDSHDEDHEHEHGEDEHATEHFDPHVWLSPQNMKLIAAAVTNALVKADSNGSEQYRRAGMLMQKDIDDLDAELTALFAAFPEKMPFLVFHPSWGYFAEEYGLRQVAIESGGREPRPADLAALLDFAREHDIHEIVIDPRSSRRSVDTIARALDASVITADPLSANWRKDLHDLARKLSVSFEKRKRQ